MILKFCQCVFTIAWLSPLGKGQGHSFEQTWILITQECFMLSLIEIGQLVLEKKMEMWKVYDNTKKYNDNDNNDGQQTTLIRKSHLSLRLRWALNFRCSYNHFYLSHITMKKVGNWGFYKYHLYPSITIHLLTGVSGNIKYVGPSDQNVALSPCTASLQHVDSEVKYNPCYPRP